MRAEYYHRRGEKNCELVGVINECYVSNKCEIEGLVLKDKVLEVLSNLFTK